ncbi:hypothetical protein [Demequina aestuarii]|uniref:hypothetical protein n=1 Tax=Demequina aestuarii TaxID=327095 RepID=UPI00128B2697|nr:hypothetical protein [Demequina aestuarii]
MFRPVAADTKSPGALLLAWAGVAAWGLAAVYFINGLTRPSGTARVAWSGQEPALPAGTGWVDGAASEGVFHFWLIESTTDRMMTRLTLVASLVTLGMVLMGAARMLQALRSTTPAPARARGARRAWLTWSAAAASAGALVPLATWLQSQTVLAAAGGPPGLEPSAGPGWGWLAAAVACLVASRLGPPDASAGPRPQPSPAAG